MLGTALSNLASDSADQNTKRSFSCTTCSSGYPSRSLHDRFFPSPPCLQSRSTAAVTHAGLSNNVYLYLTSRVDGSASVRNPAELRVADVGGLRFELEGHVRQRATTRTSPPH